MTSISESRTATGAEISENFVEHDGFRTKYLTSGTGPAVVLLHGSGPGVSGRANWALTMQSELANQFTFVAPDIVGFGETEQTPAIEFEQAARIEHVASFLKALDLAPARLVGNSMGGAISLAIAAKYPELVSRMLLMGTGGLSFPVTTEINQLYSYTPSPANMRGIFEIMAYDRSRVTDELVESRYQATLAPGVADKWASLFPAPRQRHVDAMAVRLSEVERITVPTLLIHGAHDRVVSPENTSLQLVKSLPNADLVILGRCGHWAQVERAETFRAHVAQFFSED